MSTNGSKKKSNTQNDKSLDTEKKGKTTQETTKEANQEATVLARSLRGKSKVNTLTPRQQQVLKLLTDGMTNKEIADELKTSVKTIDAHRSSIMTRLQTYNLAGLVKYAIRNGLTSMN